jgi:hypothetical protein
VIDFERHAGMKFRAATIAATMTSLLRQPSFDTNGDYGFAHASFPPKPMKAKLFRAISTKHTRVISAA